MKTKREKLILVPDEMRICASFRCNNIFKCKITSKRKYCCSGHTNLGRRLIHREVRVCAALECSNIFECKVNSEQKYCCSGHANLGKRTLKEIRICAAPSCNNIFECSITDKKRYCCNWHSRLGKEKIQKETRVCANLTCNNVFEDYPISKKRYCCRKCSDENRMTEEVKKRIQKTILELWEDPEFAQKQFKAMYIKPNKSEKFLTVLLQNLFSNQWKYVGDGEIFIARKCPDFININGQKKIIELYGDYWHKGDNPQERIDLFARYGYQTLIIWEHELEDVESLKQRILEFHRDSV